MTDWFAIGAIPLGIYLAWDVLEIIGRWDRTVRADLPLFAAPVAGLACAAFGVWYY